MYSKLFASILNSSVWSEDSDTCKVWITLVAMQDRDGYVYGSPAGLARIAALPVELVEAALNKFAAPDPQSADLTRVPEREGRRIEIVPGGWQLLNADYYRGLANEETRREQNREAKRRQRAEKPDSQPKSDPVSPSQQASSAVPKCHPSESESESESESRSDTAPPLPAGETPQGVTHSRKKHEGHPMSLDQVLDYWTEAKLNGTPNAFWDHFQTTGWRTRQGPVRDWKAAARNWSRRERQFGAPRDTATPTGVSNGSAASIREGPGPPSTAWLPSDAQAATAYQQLFSEHPGMAERDLGNLYLDWLEAERQRRQTPARGEVL